MAEAKPPWGPNLSITEPAADEPSATPTPSAVPTQVNPSVRRPGATNSCTRALPEIRVGAIANPVMNITAASTGTELMKNSGIRRQARSEERRGGGECD